MKYIGIEAWVTYETPDVFNTDEQSQSDWELSA